MLSYHVDPIDLSNISRARTILAVREATQDLAQFSGFIFSVLPDTRSVDPHPKRSIQRFINILTNEKGDTNNLPRMHNKFVEFFTNPFSRSPFSRITDIHEELARTCLNTLCSELRFNICGISSSFVRNQDILNLSELAAMSISTPLRYACECWMGHVAVLLKLSTDMQERIFTFFKDCFLFWLEVVSVLNLSPEEPLRQLKQAHVR